MYLLWVQDDRVINLETVTSVSLSTSGTVHVWQGEALLTAELTGAAAQHFLLWLHTNAEHTGHVRRYSSLPIPAPQNEPCGAADAPPASHAWREEPRARAEDDLPF